MRQHRTRVYCYYACVWNDAVARIRALTLHMLSARATASSAQMAISGCFGAPIFNMLVVLGVSLLMETARPPDRYAPLTTDVQLSVDLTIAFVAQWWVLLVLMHVVADRSYRLTKNTAKFLLAVYVMFLVVCAFSVGFKWRF